MAIDELADIEAQVETAMTALAPLRWLGVTDDLTGPDRLDEDGVSYVPSFEGEVPYFYAANAEEPRAGIVHEGAHYQQLALSWRHPRPLRRHYHSGSNEGSRSTTRS